MAPEEIEGLTTEVSARLNAESVHFGRSHSSDAMKFRHWEARHEGFPFVGHDGELAVWLLLVRRKLSEELVVGDSGRGSQLGFVVNAFPYVVGRRPCGRSAFEMIGHVEVGFIERERLDQRGV